MKHLRTIFHSFAWRDLLVALFVLLSLALFVLPIHPSLLDIFIVSNIAIAISLLIRSLLVSEPVKLFSFPTILLLTTLFRLGLNVSSTRLILLNGDKGLSAAGEVIRSFGDFVIQGDFVVGVVIFCLISVVNFLVISKGSARVAEVAARFMLDSLPGQQMSIDTDFRSGNITAKEAELKRGELARVSQFYGAMDGAMKFVQGDAIAGLVITLINAVGGISIGLSRGMSVEQALRNFGILTIGDGLVTIIPALLISVCAGVVITHVSGNRKQGLSSAIFSQLTEEPLSLFVAGLVLLLFGLMPGFSFWPFFLIGGGILAILFFFRIYRKQENSISSFAEVIVFDEMKPRIADLPRLEFKVLSLVLNPKSFVGLSIGSVSLDYRKFNNFLAGLWQQIYLERGVDLPRLSFSFSSDLSPDSYRILLREELVVDGTLPRAEIFAELGASQLSLLGIKVLREEIHPLSNCACSWVERNEKALSVLQELGAVYYTDLEYLGLSLAASALREMDSIYGFSELKTLIDSALRQHPALREEIFDKGLLTYAEGVGILRKLIAEGLSIRDLKFIFESAVDYSARFKEEEGRQAWLLELYEFVRERSHKLSLIKKDQQIAVFRVSDKTEQAFRAALGLWDYGLGLPPLREEEQRELLNRIRDLFSVFSRRGVGECLIFCPLDFRFALSIYLRKMLPELKRVRVLAEHELVSNHGMMFLGQI